MKFEYLLICIMIFHYVADFVCQSRAIAESKSYEATSLVTHATIYGFVLFMLLFLYLTVFSVSKNTNPLNILSFACINGFLHLIVDGVTSRMTSEFYARKEYYKFWCVIGGDQVIHQICLITTATYYLT